MKKPVLFEYLFALFLYGTIGVFLHFVSYSSEFVVLCRGLLGSLFIIMVMLIRKQYPDYAAIRHNLAYLIFSGFMLGLNWVFLFAAYRYSVAISSLCNYLAPLIVVIISALFYGEKINIKQIICIITAFIGVLLLLGIFDQSSQVPVKSVVYGLLAAGCFVFIVLCNRKLENISGLDRTLVQLLASAVIVLPYVIFNKGFPQHFDPLSTIIVLILGFVHTGVAYICYFAAIGQLSAETIAVLGYLEPALNVLFGALILKEPLSLSGLIGAILILGASVGNEYFANEE